MLYRQLTELYSERDCERTAVISNDNPTKIKCHKYRKEFALWIDYNVLKSSLVWNDLEYYPESNSSGRTRKSIVDNLWAYFNERGDEKGSGYEELIDCLEHSLTVPSFEHLGHLSLLKLLTSDSDKSFFESHDYRCNEAIREIVRDKIINFIVLTNVAELQPFMVKKKLLTCYDVELLDRKTYSNMANYLLTELLDTKGHCAYIIFFECLKDSVEGDHYHAGHSDIIKQIDSGLNIRGLHIGKCTDNVGVQL